MNDNYIGFEADGMGFDAHLTVMYTGPLSPEQKSSIGTYLSEIAHGTTAQCLRWEIAMFGPDQNIPVLRVIPTPYLWYLRRKIEQNSEIPNPSQFSNWNPHITLPELSIHQGSVTFPYSIHLKGFGIH